MELPDLGKKCCETTCNQLDFLPLVCECGKQFCSTHFSTHIQKCDVICKSENVDPKKIENTYTCSHENCRITSIVPLICDKCKKHFCIKHRHIVSCGDEDPTVLEAAKEKYAASQKKIQDAKVSINKQVEDKIAEAKKKEKNRHIANKVQLMRIKGKATGVKTVPLADRLYFNIHVRQADQADAEKIFPVFVSKQWSLGRTIDAVATECKLQNNNNKTSAKKLRLFKQDTGKILDIDMAVALTSLQESNIIFDGEDLVTEYVEDHCEQI